MKKKRLYSFQLAVNRLTRQEKHEILSEQRLTVDNTSKKSPLRGSKSANYSKTPPKKSPLRGLKSANYSKTPTKKSPLRGSKTAN